MRQGQQRDRTGPDPRAALSALAVLPAPDPLRALAHLLTPRTCALGMQVRVAGRSVSFRGARVRVDEDLEEAAEQIAALVLSRPGPGDLFMDLSARPARWLRPVRSGTRVVLAGSSELFAGPRVWVDGAAATPGLLAAVADAVAGGAQPEVAAAAAARFGATLQASVGSWLVSGVRATPAPRADAGAALVVEAARSAASLSADLGAQTASWVPQSAPFPGLVSVLGSLRLPCGTDVEVPLTQAHGSRLVGVPTSEVLAGMSVPVVPRGFAPVGIRLGDGAYVVEHMDSGVRAALTGRPAAEPAGSICVEGL